MDKANIAYQYRLYPNKEQAILLHKTFGCCRKVYNLMLADKIKHYEDTKKALMVTPAKYKEEYPFLKEVDSLALCNEQLRLQQAYANFFRQKNVGFPKFKSKKTDLNSYTTNRVNGNLAILKNTVKLPKIGLVKAKIHRLAPMSHRLK